MLQPVEPTVNPQQPGLFEDGKIFSRESPGLGGPVACPSCLRHKGPEIGNNHEGSIPFTRSIGFPKNGSLSQGIITN